MPEPISVSDTERPISSNRRRGLIERARNAARNVINRVRSSLPGRRGGRSSND